MQTGDIIEKPDGIYRVDSNENGQPQLTWLFKKMKVGNFRPSKVVPGMLHSKSKRGKQFISLKGTQ